MPETILVVDLDDIERERLCRLFQQEGYNILEATTSVEALLQVLESAPRLIILAEEMPPLEAADLLAVLRRLTDAPVIVIGSGGDPGEVIALEEGADFYVRRPFSSQVLLARARALIRRYHDSPGLPTSRYPVRALAGLTPTERSLLVCLAAHDGKPIPAQQLVLEVWAGSATISSVKFYVWRLRRKLQEADCGLRLQSLPAVGYRLVMDPPAQPRRRLAV